MLIRTCSRSLAVTDNFLWTAHRNWRLQKINEDIERYPDIARSRLVDFKQVLNVILVCWLCISQNSAAVEVDRLYEVEVIAKSNLQKHRVFAIKQALEIVLTRVLAGNNVLQDKTVQIILADSMRYVSEYQYSLVSPNGEAKKNSTRLMRVLFDEKLLVDTLRSSQLEFWNEIRTRTLVWLVVEDDGKKYFFDSNLMPEVDAAMTFAARQKALPVLYPIQDLKETRLLSISDILSAYSEHLLEISLRYDVVSTLAGKMVKKGNCWKAEWTLYFDGKIEQWKSQCGLINDAALNGFQGVYDYLSKYYAVKSKRQKIESAVIKIAKIKKITSLEFVSNYLQSLPMVSTATWVGEEGRYNVYRIFIQGTNQALRNKLTKDKVLSIENLSKKSSDEVTYQLISE